MKKILHYLFFGFIFLLVISENVFAVDTGGNENSSGGTGGTNTGSGGTYPASYLVGAGGMRVSVMKKDPDTNKYVVLMSKDYLANTGTSRNVCLTKNSRGFYRTRYEYLTKKSESGASNISVNWVEKSIASTTSKLDDSWGNLYFSVDYNSGNGMRRISSSNYEDAYLFNQILHTKNSDVLEETWAYKYLTGDGVVTIGRETVTNLSGNSVQKRYKIEGMGIDEDKIKTFLCGSDEVFIMIEPMFAISGSLLEGSETCDKGMYFGTVTEISEEIRFSGLQSTYNIADIIVKWLYITENSGTGETTGINWRFPMANVTSNRLNLINTRQTNYNYLLGKDNNGKVGVGVIYSWIGWIGDQCGEELKCYDVDVQQSVTAAACTDSEEDRTIEIEQRFIESESVCENKTEDQKKEAAKQTNYKGNLITGSGDTENYCGIYCSDSARIVYPTKLSSEIALDASGRLDTAVVWPDTENHKFTIQITRTCKGHVVGDVNSISGGTTACTQAIVNDTYFKSSNVASTVSFSYDDTYYGSDSSKIVVKMEDVGTVTCSGDCGSISKDSINDRSFTLTIKRQGVLDKTKSHSKYNMLTDRYAIGTETLTNGVTYDRGQIAISREAGSAVNSASTTSDKRKVFSMNLTITNLGYNNNLISSGKLAGKSQATINAYTCNYKVNGGGTCASCMSEETGNAYDVCCLEQTEADAYDKYCERGYLKKEYDTEAWRNKISKACSCVQTTNGQVVLYNMYDNSNGSCMKTYYNNKTKNNQKVSYDDAYNYCLNQAPFSTVCDDGGSNTKYCEKADGSKVNISSCMANNNNNLEYCVEQNCPKVYACPNGDTSQTTSIKACINQGNTEEYCETKYCSVCTDSSGKEISLTDCLNENNNDVDLCKAELCPVTEGKTCKEVATGLGTTVASQAENVDLTECIETQINQNNKNENDAKRYCLERKCNVCSETSKLHAGEVITEELIQQYGSVENVQKNYCDVCPTCITSCMCPRGTAGYPKFVTDIAKQYLTTGAATTEAAACKLAQDNYCNETPENDTYLYHTIDLENPFVSSNLSATASAESRTPGVNWGLSDSLSGTSVSLTEKYITSTQNVYDADNEPMYTINLTSSVINQIRNYNDSHDYGDFTLNCDYQGKVSTGVGRSVGWCLSTFLRDQSYMKTSIETTSGACYTTSSAINNAIINKLNTCKG